MGQIMYGTIARLRVKPGMEGALIEQLRAFDSLGVPGALGEYLYRMDADSHEYILVVLFRDRAAYVANAESPEQDARYRQMRALLERDPEWNDGEIIFGGLASGM